MVTYNCITMPVLLQIGGKTEIIKKTKLAFAAPIRFERNLFDYNQLLPL